MKVGTYKAIRPREKRRKEERERGAVILQIFEWDELSRNNNNNNNNNKDFILRG